LAEEEADPEATEAAAAAAADVELPLAAFGCEKIKLGPQIKYWRRKR